MRNIYSKTSAERTAIENFEMSDCTSDLVLGKDIFGETLLVVALRRNYLTLAKLLVDLGSPLEGVIDEEVGSTVLGAIFLSMEKDLITSTLNSVAYKNLGKDLVDQAFIEFCEHYTPRKFKFIEEDNYLISAILTDGKIDLRDVTDADGDNVIFTVVQAGNHNLFTLFMYHGADILSQNILKQTVADSLEKYLIMSNSSSEQKDLRLMLDYADNLLCGESDIYISTTDVVKVRNLDSNFVHLTDVSTKIEKTFKISDFTELYKQVSSSK